MLKIDCRTCTGVLCGRANESPPRVEDIGFAPGRARDDFDAIVVTAGYGGPVTNTFSLDARSLSLSLKRRPDRDYYRSRVILPRRYPRRDGGRCYHAGNACRLRFAIFEYRYARACAKSSGDRRSVRRVGAARTAGRRVTVAPDVVGGECSEYVRRKEKREKKG